ncbi:hypothetical protein C8R45DRAFT_1081018 [Mycena sanguinolenta]|nr:hypothetical protein C8R45DRAFT_1081018 [Mycena sanguinolenta]
MSHAGTLFSLPPASLAVPSLTQSGVPFPGPSPGLSSSQTPSPVPSNRYVSGFNPTSSTSAFTPGISMSASDPDVPMARFACANLCQPCVKVLSELLHVHVLFDLTADLTEKQATSLEDNESGIGRHIGHTSNANTCQESPEPVLKFGSGIGLIFGSEANSSDAIVIYVLWGNFNFAVGDDGGITRSGNTEASDAEDEEELADAAAPVLGRGWRNRVPTRRYEGAV